MNERQHWYLEFVVRDWMTDPSVSLLREATRGIWMDALCCMFMDDRRGKLVGTTTDLARLCRTTVNAMQAAIDDLKSRNAADVSDDNGVVTLINRRMRREWTDRQGRAERKRRQRSRGHTANDVDTAQGNAPSSRPMSHESHIDRKSIHDNELTDKGKEKNNDVTADVTLMSHRNTNSNSKPKKETQRAADAAAGDEPPGFVRFWSAYPRGPRKRGRDKCFAFWKRHKLEPITTKVLDALGLSKASHDWTKQGGRFVSSPHAWLNDTPWKTDLRELADQEPTDEWTDVERNATEEDLRVARE